MYTKNSKEYLHFYLILNSLSCQAVKTTLKNGKKEKTKMMNPPMRGKAQVEDASVVATVEVAIAPVISTALVEILTEKRILEKRIKEKS